MDEQLTCLIENYTCGILWLFCFQVIDPCKQNGWSLGDIRSFLTVYANTAEKSEFLAKYVILQKSYVCVCARSSDDVATCSSEENEGNYW